MPVLPAGYANSSTPLYETNENPDPVQGIVGLNGIGVSRVGDNVSIQPLAPFTISGSTGVNGNLVIDQVFTSSFTNTAGGFEFNCAPSTGFRVDVVSASNESLGVRVQNAATGATGVVGMLLDTEDQALELVAPDSDIIRLLADARIDGTDGVYVLPRGATGDAGLFLGNGSTGGNPTKYGIINTTTSQGGIFSQGHLAIVGYVGGATGPNAIMDAQADGSAIILGSSIVGGAVVEINGTLGGSRVNDPKYNPAVSDTGYTFSSGNTFSTSAGVLSGSDLSLDPGLYLFQVELQLVNLGTFSIPTGSLLFYLSNPDGTEQRDFSEMNITNTMLISPGGGSRNDPTFSSGVITITTTTACAIFAEVAGSWDLGTTGKAQFQIIKLA